MTNLEITELATLEIVWQLQGSFCLSSYSDKEILSAIERCRERYGFNHRLKLHKDRWFISRVWEELVNPPKLCSYAREEEL